jgi:hypothetical protein
MNGQLCVGIPLFRHDEVTTTLMEGYGISLVTTKIKPLAYILDCGEFGWVYSAEWVEKNLICLGEL